MRCGNGMSQKDGLAHLKVNTPKMILANACRTNRLQDAQSLNNANEPRETNRLPCYWVACFWGAYFNSEPQPERKPDLFCTFATALLKPTIFFLVGVLCSDTLAPLFDEA